jgi:protein TonB
LTARQHPFRRKLPAIAGGVLLLLFTIGVILLVRNFIGKADKADAPRIQKISLIKPPPPKPPEEKPPEPEKVQQPKDEMKVDQQQPKEAPPVNQPPPPGGIAEGPAGGMQTDLAVGSGLGGGGGAKGEREAWYGREVSRYLEDNLRHSRRLKGNDYLVTLNVWFNPNGSVQKVQMTKGSGNPQTDALISEELMAAPPMREALPGDLPQPVRVRLESRA